MGFASSPSWRGCRFARWLSHKRSAMGRGHSTGVLPALRRSSTSGTAGFRASVPTPPPPRGFGDSHREEQHSRQVSVGRLEPSSDGGIFMRATRALAAWRRATPTVEREYRPGKGASCAPTATAVAGRCARCSHLRGHHLHEPSGRCERRLGIVSLDRPRAEKEARMSESVLTSEPVAEPVVSADALDQLRIDQLHAATLKACDSCFEMKKMCGTLVVAAGTLVSVFTDKTLSRGVFVAGLAVVLTFWLADSVGYFYQRRLRSIMDGLIAARAKRCAAPYPFRPATAVTAWKAAFNGSMVFYLLLALLIALAWGAWEVGAFDGIAPASP